MTLLKNRARSAILFAVLFFSLVSCTTRIGSSADRKSLASAAARSVLIGDGIAVFYPASFNAKANLPSLALEQEPIEKGPLPASWRDRVSFYIDGKQFGMKIPVEPGTSLYGTGEVVGPLERTGQTAIAWNTDNYGYAKAGGRQLYQSHPWVLAVRKDGTAFGVLADSTQRQQISLTEGIDFLTLNAACRAIVIEGVSPQDVMTKLGSLIGTIPLPPMWALGYHQSRYSYYPDSKVREIADEFRAKKIPCDVIWLDIDYMDGFKIFTFNKSRFPDPDGLNAYLHSENFKTIWMIDPGVKKESGYAVYDSGTKIDGWIKAADGTDYVGSVWPGPCVFPDFTRPETRSWWAGMYKGFLAHGIDGVWNDMNEPAVFDGPGGTMPLGNQHRAGGDLEPDSHARYHNAYGMLMVSATREGILQARPDKRPFVLTRANFIGGQRYAATWTGDNVATRGMLEASIPMSLNLGLSGQPFSGPDIGGYNGNPDASLYSDWIALGAFYPFSRGHSSNTALEREPWSLGPDVEKTARIALMRRYMILPYTYTLFRESSLDGLPVMRPVFFADPKDASLRKEDRAFMLGGDLLVVPRWAKKPSLPKGIWREISLAGEAASNDGAQPKMLLRGGAILPTGKQILSTAEYDSNDITLYVCPDANGDARGTLYVDSGDGFGYQSGDFAQIDFVAKTVNGKISIMASKSAGGRSIDKSLWRVSLVTDSGIADLGTFAGSSTFSAK